MSAVAYKSIVQNNKSTRALCRPTNLEKSEFEKVVFLQSTFHNFTFSNKLA